jgi:hypothetical protein
VGAVWSRLPGYFATLGIPLRGRDFTLADRGRQRAVVIINEALRDRYFKDVDPIGKAIPAGGAMMSRVPGARSSVSPETCDTTGLDQDIEAYFYAPYQQAEWPGMAIVTRMREGTLPPPSRSGRRFCGSSRRRRSTIPS